MIHHRVRRMKDLDKEMLLRLTGLTNDPSRGDVEDNGVHAPGSAFKDRIYDHIDYEHPFKERCWAVMAYDWLDLVGWSMVTQRDCDYSGSAFKEPTAEVGFYVHPSHRRQGVGKGLIEQAQEVARKNGMRKLLASPWNKSGHTFFETCGFTTVTPYFAMYSRGICRGGMSVMDLDPPPVIVQVTE